MVERWMAKNPSRDKTLLAACALLLAVQVGPWWYSSIDSASYLSLARSLAQGRWPTNLGSHLWWYSPGYPALISPLFLLADRPFLGIALLQWLMAVGLMLGVYRWASGIVPGAAVWIASLTVINHGFWIHFRRPLSEIAFMWVLLGAVVCLQRLSNTLKSARFIGRLAAGATVVALLCIIRPVGIMLAPGFIVWAWRERASGSLSWPKALLASAVVGVAAATPVTIFVHHERTMAAETGGRSYADEFHDAARSPLESYSRGVQLCISDVGRVCIPGLFKSHGTPGDWADVNMVVHLPFFLLLCYGWWRWVRRQNDLFAWYMPFYLLLITAHAMDTGARLLLPLLPALFVCLWLAIERIGHRRQAVTAACLASQLIVAGGYWLGVDLPRARRYDRQWPAIDEMTARIAADPAPVGTENLPGELQRMLEVALDSPVLRFGDEGAENARWLVTLRDDHPPAGFVRNAALGTFSLWSARETNCRSLSSAVLP